MDKRKTSLKKYGISSKRYKELCGFCEQYPEWKQELAFNNSTVKSQSLTGMPAMTNSLSDETADLAIQKKIDLIEKTAKEASPEFWKEIIKSACFEQPFWYLRDISNIPISRAAFHDYRRYFFYLLNKKKQM